MNKLIITASLCFASALSCNAQQKEIDKASFCCLYTHYVKTETKEHIAAVDSFYSILEVGEKVCKYGDLISYAFQKKMIPEKMQAYAKEDCLRDEHLCVMQNYPKEGVLTVEEALHPSFFTYEESMGTLHWELLSGDSVILGYTCHPAQMSYAGREWTAWYTEDIPVSSGPWKLSGLPGLVLHAQDKTGTHCFRAWSIFNVDSQPIETVNNEYKTKETQRKTFIKTRNKIKTDPKWLKCPWYNDQNNTRIAILHKKDRDRLGIRPFVSVNRIKYPYREREDGTLDGILNYYQPLELY